MLPELTIYFIYASDCKDCDDMKTVLTDAIANSSYDMSDCKIIEINSDKDEAIDLAINNDIDDLPACIIGDYSFCGNDGYSYDSILEAMEKTWDDSQKI